MADKIFGVHMGAAKYAVDIGDGSERGEYVDQDYIINKLGRPHRAVSLMYCYYPLDKEFPGRISEVMKDANVTFQWDYPYDDYFTYKGGLEGDRTDEPFTCMRDVRRHGQDVNLTLTVDPNVSDEQLIAIAKDLRSFGRMYLRINHEATGNWFSFTKRTTYEKVAEFFVHFSDIIHEYAPNVKTVMCIGGIEHPENGEEMEMEKEFAQCVPAADVWSVDKYMALHWGWPFDVAEPGGTSHSRSKVENTYNLTKLSYERFKYLNGGVGKPMTMAEFNADGDVTGPYDQAKMVREFCDILEKKQPDWFSGFTMYQFRDRGRLGLEIQDPNNANVGIEQPLMKTYKEIIHSKLFSPEIVQNDEIKLPVTLRWGGSEDADGLAIPVHFDSDPHFCEVVFDKEDDGNYMIEINGKWFYKSPEARTIDLMPAFFENHLDGAADMTIMLFAPPASGENDSTQGDDWDVNYYYTVKSLPKVRVLCTPVEK
ncbi:MAG: hypothetical protein ACI4JK_08965 [Oscillospiraceae bacterium]